VEHDAVDLEPETALELGPSGRTGLGLRGPVEKAVGALDVALVELPVLTDLIVGDAGQRLRLEMVVELVIYGALLLG
jgi:hypothetical protein